MRSDKKLAERSGWVGRSHQRPLKWPPKPRKVTLKSHWDLDPEMRLGLAQPVGLAKTGALGRRNLSLEHRMTAQANGACLLGRRQWWSKKQECQCQPQLFLKNPQGDRSPFRVTKNMATGKPKGPKVQVRLSDACCEATP